MSVKNRNIIALMLILIFGLVIGGIIGDLLGEDISFLSRNYTIGLKPPLHLDLRVINITFGLMVDINVASVIGFILALIIYKKI